MKARHGMILLSLAFGGVVWVIDAALDYCFFYPGETFWGLLIWDLPRHELYIRSIIVACFGAFGAIMERAFAAREKAADALRRSEESERLLKGLSSRLLASHEEERKKIAADVHDSLGSQLSAVKFMVERAIQESEKGGSEAGGDCLKAVIPVIQEAIDEVRRIQRGLRPSTLDDLGILATIRWYCREFQDLYPDIRVEQRLSVEEEEVPQRMKTAAFRIMQEALSNVGAHSKADRVSLQLARRGDSLELTVADNGQGFAPAAISGGGFGLMGMRERAQLAGGVCSVDSAKGTGTTLRARWPLSEKGTEN
jgi:signal transduction histidine kinase